MAPSQLGAHVCISITFHFTIRFVRRVVLSNVCEAVVHTNVWHGSTEWVSSMVCVRRAENKIQLVLAGINQHELHSSYLTSRAAAAKAVVAAAFTKT